MSADTTQNGDALRAPVSQKGKKITAPADAAGQLRPGAAVAAATAVELELDPLLHGIGEDDADK